ncbi:hypothetical protein [Streptomyces griseorubiginosus]
MPRGQTAISRPSSPGAAVSAASNSSFPSAAEYTAARDASTPRTVYVLLPKSTTDDTGSRSSVHRPAAVSHSRNPSPGPGP